MKHTHPHVGEAVLIHEAAGVVACAQGWYACIPITSLHVAQKRRHGAASLHPAAVACVPILTPANHDLLKPYLDEEGPLQPVSLVAAVSDHHTMQQQVLSKVRVRCQHNLQQTNNRAHNMERMTAAGMCLNVIHPKKSVADQVQDRA